MYGRLMNPAAQDLDLITAPNLEVPHGFTTRAGGVSEGRFSSLNLGLSSGDAPEQVAANRARVLAAFGKTQGQVCAFNQIHSARVIEARPTWFEEDADGAVTDNPNLLLVVSAADCAPLLFHDPVQNVVGAAHSGWRGTVAGIAREVVERMGELYGSKPANVRAAIGPCIGGENYQVGEEVVEAFQNAGFPKHIYRPDDEGRFRLELVAANRWLLQEAGLREEHVWDSGLCTVADPRFFSHRRDAGRTGRGWGVIGKAGA